MHTFFLHFSLSPSDPVHSAGGLDPTSVSAIGRKVTDPLDAGAAASVPAGLGSRIRDKET
ncbi:uncharacterized protein CTRU02_200031 [Colletotrichum truncatum]|uniref:Uncharacterized protein n=1 Tax=Colletotrichum truncatum TaxID=5467 RepID=A0ACC3ZDE9_COLTU